MQQSSHARVKCRRTGRTSADERKFFSPAVRWRVRYHLAWGRYGLNLVFTLCGPLVREVFSYEKLAFFRHAFAAFVRKENCVYRRHDGVYGSGEYVF